MFKSFDWFRRASLALLFVAAVALGDTPAGTRLRIAAANLTSGPKQSYDPGHGIRILQSAHPDIVCLQEFNYKDNSPAAIREFVDTTFGKGYQYYRESSTTKNYRIPNGIVSRYPIQESGTWPSPLMPDRGFAWAKVKLPTGQDLWVVSVHLSTKSATNRKIEADALLKDLKAKVPAGAMLTIAGDMNIKGDKEFALDTLAELVGENHKPNDGAGNRFTNAPRSKLYDRVLVSPSLDTYHVPVELELGTSDPDPAKNKSVFPNGLVYDTRVLNPLPPPAQAGDSSAENMQHMMIVQDFLIPSLGVHSSGSQDPSTHGAEPVPPSGQK